jgi:hypothetical protein
MRIIRAVSIIAVSSVVAGFLYDGLVWRLHFPYLPFHPMVHLLHAQGEGAYDAMMYEMMVFFFIVFLIGRIAWRLWRTRAGGPEMTR